MEAIVDDAGPRVNRRERVGIAKRLWRAWKGAWRDYFMEEWGFVILPFCWRERRPGEPWVWAANGWNGSGGEMRIGRWEVVTDWPMPWAMWGPDDVPGWLKGGAA